MLTHIASKDLVGMELTPPSKNNLLTVIWLYGLCQ